MCSLYGGYSKPMSFYACARAIEACLGLTDCHTSCCIFYLFAKFVPLEYYFLFSTASFIKLSFHCICISFHTSLKSSDSIFRFCFSPFYPIFLALILFDSPLYFTYYSPFYHRIASSITSSLLARSQ